MSRLIDADALKEYIDAQKGRPFIGCTIGEALKMMVDEQSTIEERKTGKWVEDDEQIHVELTYHCSECGFKAWGEHEKTDYCGGCGADMRGEGHE